MVQKPPWLKAPALHLDNWMMSCSSLNVEVVKITEQWKLDPKLKMMALSHIKYKLIGSNAPPLIQKVGGVPTCTT